MGLDPYAVDHLAWETQLREAGDAYLEADDYLKVANEELKPYRKKKKDSKASIEELMRAHRVDRYYNEERGEALVWTHRKAPKRRPNEDQIRERCTAFCKNEKKGEELFKFIMLPDEEDEASAEPTFALRRKKIAVGDNDPLRRTAAATAPVDVDF